MIRKSLFFILVIIPVFLFSQTEDPNTVEFKYDDAGNRILRHAIYVIQSGKKADSANADYRDIPSDFIVLDDVKVNIFPNPTISKFNVTFENIQDEDNIEYSLHSLSGQIISRGEIKTKNIEFNMEEQKSGPYIFYICINGSPKSWTVIKQ